LSCDEPAADEFKNEIQKLIANEGFIPEQIFNADETGLYWKCLPKKTLAYETETSAAGRKVKKQRSTVFVLKKRLWDTFYENVSDRNREKASRIFRNLKFPIFLSITTTITKLGWTENFFVTDFGTNLSISASTFEIT
jgi:hypothetical protein